MSVWFTADPHFGHANIIKYQNRPFKDSVEMDSEIISRYNSRVGKQDLVYLIGDFCFGDDRAFERYFNALNGLIVFVKGNHDRTAWANRKRFYSCSDGLREIRVHGQDITLCHYAMRVWNKSHHGAWHLYGHSHGTLPEISTSRSFDVGVDTHDFYPWSFDEVAEKMKTKSFSPIDHHGAHI